MTGTGIPTLVEQGLTIRAAEPGDVVQIAELLSRPQVIWGTLQMPFVSVAARMRRFDESNDADLILVAQLQDTIVGSAGLRKSDSPRRAHSAEIGIAVHDDYTRRGIGRALMSTLVDYSDNWMNIRRIEFTVWADNLHAIRLYESLGFEIEGRLKSYLFRDGHFVDAFAMARIRE